MLRYFYKKFGTTWPRSKIKSHWLPPARFFYFPNHNRNGWKVQYAYSNWHFCCCLWTVNTMGIVVVYTHSVRPFSVRKNHGKRYVFRRRQTPLTHRKFVLCVSGHFSVFEVLNFFVQQIIKNAPNQISGSLNESILRKNLKRLKRAFKIVLGNFEIFKDCKTRKRTYQWYAFAILQGFPPLDPE